jgi:3-deoxy-manno-octulosonate cytidylyltransferase (CMP-KDO synthetase)
MASTRLPGKPMALLHGMPMLGHVYHRSRGSTLLEQVYVATCDDPIARYAESIGATAVMTADTHERASERAAEALVKIEQSTGRAVDIAVMIQGDEPMVRPEMIDDAVRPMTSDPSIEVVNLMAEVRSAAEHDDVNEVKVVVDRQGFALYFSREPIPSRRKGGPDVPKRKQVCVIPFRRDFLLKFNELAPTPLEIAESVDMMRVLEHGHRVKMVPTSYPVHSVDTEADRQRVEAMMAEDPLMRAYL